MSSPDRKAVLSRQLTDLMADVEAHRRELGSWRASSFAEGDAIKREQADVQVALAHLAEARRLLRK